MDARDASVVTPTLRSQDQGMSKKRWISAEEFNPGYLERSIDKLPKRGDHEPWDFTPDYYIERERLPNYDLDEDTLVYS